MKHTLEQCKKVHCRCMNKDCPNNHYADCESYKPAEPTMQKTGTSVAVPPEMIPSGFNDARFNGVFLLFITGKSQKEIKRKCEQIRKLADIVATS